MERGALAGRASRRPAEAPVNATSLIRGMFHKISNKPQPGMGVLPPEWLETSFMPAAVRKVTSTRALHAFSLQYGEPLGDAGLRRALAGKLAALSVPASPEQIITSVGATHALDIVSRTLLRPGDPVMVEEPGWAVEFARLTALGMRLLPVPRRADGPDLEVMAKYCKVHKPKLYVSVSVFHNPTSYCLSPGSAHRILQLANQHDFHIVEDDTYSHLAPEHATRMCALDGLQRTIHVSGFAKILAPNWRIGFMAAPPQLVEQLLDTKLLATLTTPALLEKALALCMEQGQLRRHAELRIRTRAGLPGPQPQREARAASRLPLRCGAGRPVRLGGHRCRHRRALAAHAGRGLPARARGAVPCRTHAQHADAHQLRDHAGSDLLEEVRGAGEEDVRREVRLTAHEDVRRAPELQSIWSGANGPSTSTSSSFRLVLAPGSLSESG